MSDLKKTLIIGGGFAGIAAAYWARRQDPRRCVTLLERADSLLPWTGRRGMGPVVMGTVTAEGEAFEADYPRGWPEVERVLQKWPGAASCEWLETLGIGLERYGDGRVRARAATALPAAMEQALRSVGVELHFGYAVESISRQGDGGLRIWSRDGHAEAGDRLVLATGGERNHGLALAREAGLSVAEVVPAYVRLRLASLKLGDQLGPITRDIRISCPKSGLAQAGTATLSARGLEGPALSRLAAMRCLDWSQRRYRLALTLDWVPDVSPAAIRADLLSRSHAGGRKRVGATALYGFSERQWQAFLALGRIDPQTSWGRLKQKQLQMLVQRLKAHALNFDGMGLPADERAWAGGVSPDRIDWNTGESQAAPGLFCAGEVLDLLGMPGGPQEDWVWASGYLAGSGAAL
jgi:predicted Rossmann fold flavoprotein